MKSQGRDSDKEENQYKGEEESDAESSQSSMHHVSLNEHETPSNLSSPAVTRRKQSTAKESSPKNETDPGNNNPKQAVGVNVKDTDSRRSSDRKTVQCSNKESEKPAKIISEESLPVAEMK